MTRTRIHLTRTLVLVALAGAIAAGCNKSTAPKTSGPALGTLAPDFAIRDVNPNSARYQAPVSPRDYFGRVSAWYFGHAT